MKINQKSSTRKKEFHRKGYFKSNLKCILKIIDLSYKFVFLRFSIKMFVILNTSFLFKQYKVTNYYF